MVYGSKPAPCALALGRLCGSFDGAGVAPELHTHGITPRPPMEPPLFVSHQGGAGGNRQSHNLAAAPSTQPLERPTAPGGSGAGHLPAAAGLGWLPLLPAMLQPLGQACRLGGVVKALVHLLQLGPVEVERALAGWVLHLAAVG